jgi:hypothetical protein
MNNIKEKKPDTGEEQMQACIQGIKKALSAANLWIGDFYDADNIIKEADDIELKITKESISVKVSSLNKVLTYDFKTGSEEDIK